MHPIQDHYTMLLPALFQAATPAEPRFGGLTAAAKALPDMAVRLVTGLAAGATAPTFRAVVAELPPVLKQRLQVGLRSSLDFNLCAQGQEHDAVHKRRISGYLVLHKTSGIGP